jgi:hypothetical protein
VKKWPWNLWKMQGKWWNGEVCVLLNFLFHCMHQIFINHRQLAALRIIMHIFTSFIKVSHPSPYHWITRGMFSIHLTKLTMKVSWFHVSCIQETDYRPHFTCSGLLDFLEHFKHRTMRKHGSIVCKLRLCLPKGPTTSACMCTIVTAALQRQYLQTELILWICLVHDITTQKIVLFTVSTILWTFTNMYMILNILK